VADPADYFKVSTFNHNFKFKRQLQQAVELFQTTISPIKDYGRLTERQNAFHYNSKKPSACFQPLPKVICTAENVRK
jgi:hypothetical protein